jgi:hypothetical protein
MNNLIELGKLAGMRAIGNETTRILAEAKRRQKTNPTTQRNANRLAALLKPEAKTNTQRREQLNRALSK